MEFEARNSDVEQELLSVVESRLVEMDEAIAELSARIEEARSNEQAVPLRMGCSLFGLFGLFMLVLAFFVTVGREYFGGWLFYFALVAVLIAGLVRLRKKMMSEPHIEELKTARLKLDKAMEALETERGRVQTLRESLLAPSGDPRNSSDTPQ